MIPGGVLFKGDRFKRNADKREVKIVWHTCHDVKELLLVKYPEPLSSTELI